MFSVPVIPSSDLPTVEDVRGFNAEELNGFLKRRLNSIDNHINTLTAQEVMGVDFLALKYEILEVSEVILAQTVSIIPNTYLFLCCSFLLLIVKPTKKHIRIIVDQPVAESSSKRRKYDNDDEKLGRFWNALKGGKVEKHDGGQFLELSRDVYYLLAKMNKNENVRRWRITGNPGIGKTFFGYYLLYLLSQQRKTVVYHKLNRSPILFSEEGVFSHAVDNIRAFKDYLGNEEVWYIVDGREPMEYVAKTILVCSPQKRHYSSFDKLGTTIRYMPVWSWEEIDACRTKLFRNLTQEYVRKLYNEWGGIPRFTLFYALNDSQQDLLLRAINSVNDNLLNFVGETTDDNSASHKIVHICTNIPKGEDEGEDGEEGGEGVEDVEITEVEDNPGESSTSKSPAVTRPDKRKNVIGKGKPFYSMSTLEFASDYVSEEIMDKLIKNYRDKLENFVKASSSINDYSSLRGAIFERIAHRKLLKGGSFRTRPLFASTVSCFGANNSNLSIPTRKKRLFSDISEIVPNMYCIPTQKNNASFDAFVFPDTFFQMTVSENHPIIKSGLEKYIKDDNSDIKFYFVLPKEIYNSYQEQVLYTTKRTVLKNRPPWINRLRQYALEIDLKL
ncbi:2086_t:CDS:2 [Paraglomus occultum]|uniref:2086_t:CDS:1 n=1 Tax=Paraglomus occultum TaxID=144539 RepID=A0A9N9CUH5_9GLOM|nr:2086_t:CDS:2 [Paraglomus occultum]